MDSAQHLDDLVAAAKSNSEAIEENLKLIESLNNNVELLDWTKVNNNYTVRTLWVYIIFVSNSIKLNLFCSKHFDIGPLLAQSYVGHLQCRFWAYRVPAFATSRNQRLVPPGLRPWDGEVERGHPGGQRSSPPSCSPGQGTCCEGVAPQKGTTLR